MTPELSQALLVIGIVAIYCAAISPILCWILPKRTRQVH